jgi:hypothetical protein
VATVSGSTVGATDDGSASCGGWGSPDVFYRLTLTQAASLDAELQATDAGFFGSMTVALGTGCGTSWDGGAGGLSGELACNLNDPGNLSVGSLAPGDYLLTVDGPSFNSGAPFSLTVTLGAPH